MFLAVFAFPGVFNNCFVSGVDLGRASLILSVLTGSSKIYSCFLIKKNRKNEKLLRNIETILRMLVLDILLYYIGNRYHAGGRH